ncbi:MAG: AsmA family protein [Gammaproteobacteria bacterium]|nr:AsmA family protein [Gammaproteobacteria bacterium]
MARLRQHLLNWLASLLVFFTALLITVILSLDLNSYRPRLEQALTQALGARVAINGDLGLALKPDIALTIEGLSIGPASQEIASVEQLSVFMALLPLLRREIEIESIDLVRGTLNLNAEHFPMVPADLSAPAKEIPEQDRWHWKLTQAASLHIRHGQLSYTNVEPSWTISLDDFDLRLKTRELSPTILQQQGVDALNIKGSLRSHTLVSPWASLKQAETDVSLIGRDLSFDGIRAQVFGAKTEANAHIAFLPRDTIYNLDFHLKDLEAAQSINRLAREGLVEGEMQLRTKLRWQGSSSRAMISSLNGTVSLHGEKLKLNKIDLDKSIEAFEKSQHFNLVDLGAYFFMGPMGTVATKGFSFAKLGASFNGGSSHISRLNSDWVIENGVARADDVAFSTQRNLLAVQGHLDLVQARYEGITFAIVDTNGCARFSQEVSGPLSRPVVEAPRKLSLITAPVREVLEIPRKLLGSDKCKPFYRGSLSHPNA